MILVKKLVRQNEFSSTRVTLWISMVVLLLSATLIITYGIYRRTEGWDCDLGFGAQNFCFGNNGLGGFLGPNWKVFHH